MSTQGTQQSKQPANPRPGITSWGRNWRGWGTVILLFLVLEIAVLSLEQAHWINPQPSLTLILVLSLLAAGLLIRSRLPGIVAHVIALILGGGVTGVQVVLLPTSDTLAFAGFLSGLTWIMGYLATWYLIKHRNPWVAVVLGTVVLLINLSNLADNYYYFFGLFFIAAIFLVTWTRILKQHYALERPRGTVMRGLLSLGAILTCIIIVAVFTARIIPEARIPKLQTQVAKNMLWKQDLENSFFNLFAKVPSKAPLNTTSTREGVSFGSAWTQKEQVDFVINSPVPSYWRVKLYDSYTSQGWKSKPVDDQLLDNLERWDLPAENQGGRTITYSVTANIKTDVILTAGNFIASDTTTLVSTNEGEIMTIRMPRVIGPGEHYTVTSAVSTPSPEELALVPAGYPSSLSHQYVRLPADFPDSVRELSDELTGGLSTPYEKVVAIDAYLAQFPYSDEIDPPPPGTDSMEYFLFTEKSGYCLYFASAMVVMLRSADVPARLAVGYIPGDPGENPGEYILRNKHYHAWPQVYFSGYGWVDLEATPSGGTSEVVIEEPWVADATPVEYPNLDIPQPPGSIPLPYPIVPPILPAATEPVKTRPGGSLPFADELGMTLLVLAIIAGILMVVAVPFLIARSVFSSWIWRVDRSNLAASVYARACRLAAMAGMAPAPHQTPREFTAALAVRYPEEAAALNDIARTYADVRFGGKGGKLELYEEAMMLKARRTVYNIFFNRLGWIRRLLRKS